MKQVVLKQPRTLLAVSGAVVLVAQALIACGPANQQPATGQSAAPQAPQGVPVTTIKVARESATRRPVKSTNRQV